MNATQLDSIARKYHQKWLAIKEGDDWTPGPSFDHDARISPMICEWEKLSPDAVNFFYISAATMLSLVPSLGTTPAPEAIIPEADPEEEEEEEVEAAYLPAVDPSAEASGPPSQKIQLKIPVSDEDGSTVVTAPFKFPDGSELKIFVTETALSDNGAVARYLERGGRKLSDANRTHVQNVVAQHNIKFLRSNVLHMESKDPSQVGNFLTFAQAAVQAIEVRHSFRS